MEKRTKSDLSLRRHLSKNQTQLPRIVMMRILKSCHFRFCMEVRQATKAYAIFMSSADTSCLFTEQWIEILAYRSTPSETHGA